MRNYEELDDKPGRNHHRIGNGIGIHSPHLGWDVVGRKGVWMMLNKRDIALMIGTGIMIVIATEMIIWAITGYGILR